MTRTYTSDFFREISEPSRRSAQEIVPLILEMIQPRSVIDIGCGTGAWLSVFKDLGVDDVWGVDGDYVDRSLLQIPPERFIARDLTQPFTLERDFDLVISLEVAEHLPPESAGAFVGSLVKLGPVILFSAAIPRQGGTHHVNEQWPEYWAERFRARGYQAIDCVRERIWNNQIVKSEYAQNSFIYATPESLERLPGLKMHLDPAQPALLPIVHPKYYLRARDFSDVPLRKVLAALPRLFKRAIRWRARRISNVLCGRED
jgi:SAM-dependent methyltransferase